MEILLFAFLSAARGRKGVKRCKVVVLGMRAALGMGEEVAQQLHPESGLLESQRALTAYCRCCRKCEVGRAA